MSVHQIVFLASKKPYISFTWVTVEFSVTSTNHQRKEKVPTCFLSVDFN